MHQTNSGIPIKLSITRKGGNNILSAKVFLLLSRLFEYMTPKGSESPTTLIDTKRPRCWTEDECTERAKVFCWLAHEFSSTTKTSKLNYFLMQHVYRKVTLYQSYVCCNVTFNQMKNFKPWNLCKIKFLFHP